MLILCCRALHRYSRPHNLCFAMPRGDCGRVLPSFYSPQATATHLYAGRQLMELEWRHARAHAFGGYFGELGRSVRQPEQIMFGNLAGPGAAQKKKSHVRE